MSTSTRRNAPLAAQPVVDELPTPGTAPGAAEGPTRDRLTEEVRTMRIGRTGLRLEERILMVIGGVIAPLGLIVVILGWWGAAHTPYVFEQVPYLISGGLLGLSLVVLGGFCYFAHWLTQLIKEQRAQSRAVLDALERLAEEVGRRPPMPVAGVVGTNGTTPPTLVATERGTMAHRPDCSVVAGKAAVRSVTATEGLIACKLCEPHHPGPPR